MNSQITELRYSFNGISEMQMELLFNNLEQMDSQVIMKRIGSGPSAISLDDIILEGVFSEKFIETVARALPPPLSFRIETENNLSDHLRSYSSFEWRENPVLFCGVTVFPFADISQQVNFENPWQFLRLISTTEVSSILKPLLVVKPKGLVAVSNNKIEFILPRHRIDFLSLWTEQIQQQTIDINWISGLTGELPQELIESVGSIDQSRTATMQTLLERTSIDDDFDFEKQFRRALLVLDQ